MAARFLFDSSIYITILRDENFAQEFRPRYIRDIPRTHFSSVVIQELIARARTFRHRRQAAALYEPFERAGRTVTPSHRVWKEVGTVVVALAEKAPQWRDKLSRGLLNDLLIALSGRSIVLQSSPVMGKTFVSFASFRHSLWRSSDAGCPSIGDGWKSRAEKGRSKQ
jgi:predicted nucleic acid-binding protein